MKNDLLDRFIVGKNGVYSPKMRVRFLAMHGHEGEPQRAIAAGLIEGQIYDLESIEIGEWYSFLQIKGVKGQFNSVMFEGMPDEVA